MTLPRSVSSTNLIGREVVSPTVQPAPANSTPGISSSSMQEQNARVRGAVPLESDRESKARSMPDMSRTSPPRNLLPPFSSRRYSHLPTPQSPNNIGHYISGVPYSPESPAPQGSLQSSHPLAPPSFSQRYPYYRQPEETSVQATSKPQQIMTPDSSPVALRSSPTPRYSGPSRFNPHSIAATTPRVSTSNLKLESPTTLAPAHQISPPSSVASPDTASQSRISSPFMARLSLAGRNSAKSASPLRSQPASPPSSNPSFPVHVDDVFTAESTMSMSTPPRSPSLPQAPSGGEIERIRVQMLEEERAHAQEAESRRPEYLRRTKRSLTEADPSMIQGSELEEREQGIPGVGITVSPNKGRRLKLFQETSEESFEESLMAGGYGRYRTSDWVEQPTPGPPGPSNHISELEAEVIPTEKEVKKRKRLAAFRDSARSAPSSKLLPVEVEGKGRVLLDASSAEAVAPAEAPPKKRAPRRKKKGTAVETPLKERSAVDGETDPEGPNWPDTEFPWSLRMEEHAELVKAEEEERLKWIEKFLDRDSDEEEDNEDEEIIPSAVWGQVYEDPPMPSRRGRGKMVPLRAHPNAPSSSQHRRSAFFPSDPADARAALLSKKSVRSLSFRNQRRKIRGDNYYGESDEEVVCICRGRDDGRELVQCDGCQTWYHLECIGIRDIKELGDEDDPWFCFECEGLPKSRTPTPELVAPSSEPTFVPTEDEPSGSVPPDPLFFQTSLQDSPMPSWSTARPPKTPTRGGDAATDVGASWNTGPSTPHYASQGVRVYSTPGPFDNYTHDDLPFDPTSTPSRGIKISAPFTTPKNMWSARANGLFQTPSKPAARGSSSSRARIDGTFPSSLDDSGGTEASFGPYRSLPTYDDSPIRRTMSLDRPKPISSRRLFESPTTSRMAHQSLEESPVVRSTLMDKGHSHDLYEGRVPRE